MIRLTSALWRCILCLAPTSSLQEAMCGRPGVDAFFVSPGEERRLDVRGMCWVTINED